MADAAKAIADPKTEPLCVVCKKDIQGKILTALGNSYHPEHFTCAKCDKPIKDEKFQQNEGKPYCDEDYTKLFCKKCHSCDKPIKEKLIKAMGKEWHEEHFTCAKCKKRLAGITFFEKDGKPYCEADYYRMFSAKCKGCSTPIKEKHIIALNEKWHEQCFKCLKCRQPVADEAFQVKNGQPICAKCTT